MSLDKITKGDELTQSLDIVNDNIARLKELFPEVLTEGKIDFKVLQDILGKEIEEEEEYYRFTWAGKAQARREAHKPSTGTLRPAKEESVNWDTTENLYIEGDNLEVLKLLQKSYNGKVKMIYIDPPYNTGKDFVYKDNYKDNLKNYQQVTGQIDGEGNKLFTNSDSDGRYHSNWLNMIYPRLLLARNLLVNNGIIFISIDNNEADNLRKLCDEVFGESNSLMNFVWELPRGINAGYISKAHEYILTYAKDINTLNQFFRENSEISIERCNKKVDSRHPESAIFFPAGIEYEGEDKDITGTIDGSEAIRIDGELTFKDGKLHQSVTLHAGWTMRKMIEDWIQGKEIVDLKGQKIKRFFFKENGKLYSEKVVEFDSPKSLLKGLGDSQTARKELQLLFGSEDIFDYPKPTSLINRLASFVTKEDDIILDFFSGSAVTADSVFQLNSKDLGNRKFVLVQLPEPTPIKSEAQNFGFKTITEIGKERIRRVGKKIAEENPEKAKDLDLGFKVFKLDSSNIKGWDGNPDNLVDNLFDSQDNIKEGRTEEDVLFEILLKYGLDLTLPIEEKIIEGKKVFSVGFGALFICLADGITNKVAEGIGAWKEALNPEVCRVIFKDSGFGDVEKTNSVQTLKRFGINEIKSI
ncbi:site-specific DNA-methyltransferase [Flavobacterium sp. XS2P39]|uniref:site-specific DNA-methyltransferase n=1 Tax=Flavobacterium sp. XS2P39 TaxID=3401725 RepID=UPI003AAF40FE